MAEFGVECPELQYVADKPFLPPDLWFIFSFLLCVTVRRKCRKNFLYNSETPERVRKKAGCIKEDESFGTLQLEVWLLFYFHSR
jgi:hypothetical protein